MTIQDRILESEQRFEVEQAARNEQLAIIKGAEEKATEHLTEMTKLQGEWRVLKQLELEESGEAVIVSEDAGTITVEQESEED